MLTAVAGTADHVPRNRAAWDRLAAEYAGPGLRNWARPEPTWGIWNIPEAQAGVHGEMIRLLRDCGLEVEDLLELRPGPDGTTRYPFVTLEWARQWPCEEVWKARKSR
jgi:hypothetical protein